jgi:rRNA maturation endonuclease Nob1
MKKQAKRLEFYLRETLGWETRDWRRECKKCTSGETSPDSKYCRHCGTKLPRGQSSSAAIEELEEALEFALKPGEKP